MSWLPLKANTPALVDLGTGVVTLYALKSAFAAKQRENLKRGAPLLAHHLLPSPVVCQPMNAQVRKAHLRVTLQSELFQIKSGLDRTACACERYRRWRARVMATNQAALLFKPSRSVSRNGPSSSPVMKTQSNSSPLAECGHQLNGVLPSLGLLSPASSARATETLPKVTTFLRFTHHLGPFARPHRVEPFLRDKAFGGVDQFVQVLQPVFTFAVGLVMGQQAALVEHLG